MQMAYLGTCMPFLDLRRSKADNAEPAYYSSQVVEARRFYLGSREADRRVGHVGLTVVGGGREKVSDDYRIGRSGFPHIGLEFVAAGRGWLRLGGEAETHLVPGTLFTYDRKVPHEIRTDADDPLVKYFVDFSGPRARQLLRAIPLLPGSAAHTSAPAELIGIFDELIRSGVRSSRLSHAVCAALLEALLLTIADSRTPAGTAETPAFSTYLRCRGELQDHALEIRDLSDLADRCGVAPAYLCRLFKRFDQESPYQRLQRLKMSHAASMLQSQGVLVKQVAAALGFDDPCHFSRAFKRVLGLSPTSLLSPRPAR